MPGAAKYHQRNTSGENNLLCSFGQTLRCITRSSLLAQHETERAPATVDGGADVGAGRNGNGESHVGPAYAKCVHGGRKQDTMQYMRVRLWTPSAWDSRLAWVVSSSRPARLASDQQSFDVVSARGELVDAACVPTTAM